MKAGWISMFTLAGLITTAVPTAVADEGECVDVTTYTDPIPWLVLVSEGGWLHMSRNIGGEMVIDIALPTQDEVTWVVGVIACTEDPTTRILECVYSHLLDPTGFVVCLQQIGP